MGNREGYWGINPSAPLNSVGQALYNCLSSKRKLDCLDNAETQEKSKKPNHLVELSALALASLEELTRRESDEESSDSFNYQPQKETSPFSRSGYDNIIQDAWTIRPQLTSNPDPQNPDAGIDFCKKLVLI